MNIQEKLLAIQSELKAPKSQFNNFGKYSYRSCEDILEAVKPLLSKHGATLIINDELVLIGNRYYIKATAKIFDTDGEILTSAYAREEENKKGMDGSQITGSASSYARKYALNGLFCIDDTKDADSTNKHGKEASSKKISVGQLKSLEALLDKLPDSEAYKKQILHFNKIDKLEDLNPTQYGKALQAIRKKIRKITK